MRSRRILAVAFSISLIGVGCRGSAQPVTTEPSAPTTTRSSAPTTIRLSVVLSGGSATELFALDRGYFAAENLEVKIVDTFVSNAIIPALLRGDLDILGGQPSAAHYQIFNEQPGAQTIIGAYALFQQWGNLPANQGVWVRKALVDAGSFSSPADIKGKTIYLSAKGNTAEYVIDKWLRQNGMTYDDVKIGSIGGGQSGLGAAMRNGSIDFVWVSDPVASDLLNDRVATQVFSGTTVNPGGALAVFTANSNFVRTHPDATTAFLRAMRKASADYRKAVEAGPSSPAYQDIAALMSKRLNVDYTGIPLTPGLAIELNVNDINAAAEFFHRRGYISKVPDIASYVDTKYFDASR